MSLSEEKRLRIQMHDLTDDELRWKMKHSNILSVRVAAYCLLTERKASTEQLHQPPHA